MKEKKISIAIEAMIGLGCLGSLEMIIINFNWRTIMENDTFQLLRPGEAGAQIAVLLLLVGFFGLLAWFFGLFNTHKRGLKTRNILALVFILEFFTIAYLYQGI